MTSTLPASLLLTSAPRTAELRGWAVGLRDLRRDAIDLSVRGRAGVPGVRAGERCFAIATGSGRWLIGLADAQGPGDGAADAARAVVGHLRRAAPFRDLQTVLAGANRFARESIPGRLVEMTLLDVDAPRHAVRIAVAGGVAALAAGRSGDVVALGERGPALGLVADAKWSVTGPVRLAPGHLLAAVTDGIVDRARDDGTTFGEARVAALLSEHRGASPRTAARALLDQGDAWSGDDPADRTALALRLRGR